MIKQLIGAIWINPQTGEVEVAMLDRFYKEHSTRDQRDILLVVEGEIRQAALDSMDAADEEADDRFNSAIIASATNAVASALAA